MQYRNSTESRISAIPALLQELLISRVACSKYLLARVMARALVSHFPTLPCYVLYLRDDFLQICLFISALIKPLGLIFSATFPCGIVPSHDISKLAERFRATCL